jgi:hypothetical protein
MANIYVNLVKKELLDKMDAIELPASEMPALPPTLEQSRALRSARHAARARGESPQRAEQGSAASPVVPGNDTVLDQRGVATHDVEQVDCAPDVDVPATSNVIAFPAGRLRKAG